MVKKEEKKAKAKSSKKKAKNSLPLSQPCTPDMIIDLARQHGPLAIGVLVEIAKDSDKDAARVSAANSLLDRGFGKPSQHVEVSGSIDLISAIQRGRERATKGS